MEADSTTHSYDSSAKAEVTELALPFNTCPGNMQLFKELTSHNGEQRLEYQLVERLQTFGLLPKVVKCPSDKPECKVIFRNSRVIDRVQWVCVGCNKRQPIRTGSFFYRLQCSILQALQMILAWCEDADLEVAAAHFGVKPKVATHIFDRLDDLAIREQKKRKLGGDNSVVLAEMYPDCVNRLSPDTTDQPHAHRILMLADTNHIPTSYWLHVMRGENKNATNGVTTDIQALTTEVEEVVRQAVIPNSLVVTGNNVPLIEGASSIQQLLQHCDVDMQHFLSSRIWRQAVTVCCASRSMCTAGPSVPCAAAVQRYLSTAAYRLAHDTHFLTHTLASVAREYTDEYDKQ